MQSSESSDVSRLILESSRDVSHGFAAMMETHPKLCTNPTQFIATRATWEKWLWEEPLADVSTYRACDALALYHRLDPDRLGLTQTELKYFNNLCRQLVAQPDHIVKRFESELTKLRRDIADHKLEVFTRSTDPALCVMPLAWFLPYMNGRPLIGGSVSLAVSRAEDVEGPPPWPCRHVTKKMLLTIRAQALYATRAEGGTYEPGEKLTIPDVAGFVRAQHAPESWAKDIASLLSPPENVGRRRKSQSQPPGRRPAPPPVE